MKKTASAPALLFAFVFVTVILSVILSGCSENKTEYITPSDTETSEEEVKPVDADQAVKIFCCGREIDDVFVMRYDWYGETYVSEDSLNKTMMDHYGPEGHYATQVSADDILTISFDTAEGMPSEMTLTQYANTVRANSGIPYDVLALELSKTDDHTCSFTVEYRTYRMYYYELECKWLNGNTALYAFAVEKPQ